jgi:hypothetical protein
VGLEAQSGAAGLAPQSLQQLERLIIESVEFKQPLTIGSSYGVRLNIHQSVTDVIVPHNAKVIVCIVNAGDQAIGSVQVPVTGCIVDGNTIGVAIRTDLAWPLMLWYFHLNLPPDSLLKVKLYWLLQESRPLYIARGMAGLIWPLFYWQLCTGLLREPRLLARFLGLVLRMRSVRFGLQLIRAKSRPRKYLVKEFLWDMARQFVREERLVTTAPTAASTQTIASEGDCSYIKILWGCIRRVALK